VKQALQSKALRTVLIVVGVLLLSYIVLFRIPIKVAIAPDELHEYEGIIVVRDLAGPPTDYLIIGDQRGLFPQEVRSPVWLEGKVPPDGYGTGFYLSHNRYVCFVEPAGERAPHYRDALSPAGEQYPIYNVTDWTVLAPVERGEINPLFDALFSPRDQVCLVDMLLPF
jgi:hypothetical protein